MKILFVCKGNVGRSQMAEAIFKQLNNNHEIRSAGTKVVGESGESKHGQALKDLPGAENVILSLQERGIKVAENKRDQLNQGMVDWADKVIVMAELDTIPDYLAKSPKVIYWEIENPKGFSLDAHKAIMDQIEGKVKKFIEEIEII